MPLSDEERKRLEELENLLSAQDPSLARNLETGKPGGPVPRRLLLTILAILAGLALVIVGIATQTPLIGVAGFALECIAAYRFLPTQGSQNRNPLITLRDHKPGNGTI